VDRTILESEELEIFRAIKGQKGNAKIVELALFGAAFEPAHEGFNPKDYVKISRIFRPSKNGDSKLPDFVNWGAKKRAEIKADEYRKAKDEKIEEEVERCDPATVRAILEKTFPTSRRMAQEGA
jgi:molybdenum cofactor biosynthesis enzyme MoaA